MPSADINDVFRILYGKKNVTSISTGRRLYGHSSFKLYSPGHFGGLRQYRHEVMYRRVAILTRRYFRAIYDNISTGFSEVRHFPAAIFMITLMARSGQNAHRPPCHDVFRRHAF